MIAPLGVFDNERSRVVRSQAIELANRPREGENLLLCRKDEQNLSQQPRRQRGYAVASLEDLGNLKLKGLSCPVPAFNVLQSTSPAEARPNLTVVARDTGA